MQVGKSYHFTGDSSEYQHLYIFSLDHISYFFPPPPLFFFFKFFTTQTELAMDLLSRYSTPLQFCTKKPQVWWTNPTFYRALVVMNPENTPCRSAASYQSSLWTLLRSFLFAFFFFFFFRHIRLCVRRRKRQRKLKPLPSTASPQPTRLLEALWI